MITTLNTEQTNGEKPNIDPKRALAAKICATMFSTMPIPVKTEVTSRAFWPYSMLMIS